MASLDDEFAFKSSRPPKALAGVSIMLVDDSRSVSEAIRMMAVRSGARIRRADCIASAKRHVMLFRPNVVIVDLGLPDGSGMEVVKLVEEMLEPRPGTLILSAVEEDVAIDAVRECGADGYLMKPITSLGAFQEAVLDVLPGGLVSLPEWDAEFNADMSDSEVYGQDLENALDLLEEALRDENRDELVFAAQFLAGTASTVGDQELTSCAQQLNKRLLDGHKGANAAQDAIGIIGSRLSGVVSEAG